MSWFSVIYPRYPSSFEVDLNGNEKSFYGIVDNTLDILPQFMFISKYRDGKRDGNRRQCVEYIVQCKNWQVQCPLQQRCPLLTSGAIDDSSAHAKVFQ